MMTSLTLQAAPAQAPALSPRLQRAVRLLQMSSLDYAQVVRHALDSNPFLEADDPGAAQDDEPPDPQEADADTDADTGWEAELPGAPPPEAGEGGVFDTLAAPAGLADQLLAQLRVLRLAPREFVLAEAVVRCLDDDGYLRLPLAEVGAAAGLRPEADGGELAIALRRVQALEPAGVGARDLGECLRLQLQLAGGRDPCARLALAIVRDHLPALAGRDPGALARRLGAPREAVEAACAAIRRLDPRPGARLAQAVAGYVTPDVVVRRRRGQWRVQLNAAVVPRVRVHQAYAELFERHRAAGHAELGSQLQEARWTVRNVEQRFATILAVARAIVRRQHRFLAYGPMAMQPLALREIAREVGVHESTVSRVTNNKYLAAPSGVFELKYFFSRGLATASGGACSPTAVRGLIRDLIAAEPPGAPLSDVALARALAGQGLQVARRTVTKYRQQLRIEPADRRSPSIR